MKEADQRNAPPVDTSNDKDKCCNDMEVDQHNQIAEEDGFQGFQDAGNQLDFDEELMHDHLDDNLQSNHSWDHVETPPPSPLQSPPPGASDKEDDKDDFLNITNEDYCEYEHWFGEEQEEIDKIFGETLTEEELDSFKMLAIHLFGCISQQNYECIQYSFKDKIQLLLTYCLHKKLTKLSGITPVTVDCCFNVCLAFTGEYADDTHCSKCKTL
ncbi:hypothetical protein OPQ81_011067 [Rhizoctonia solani]|nr:hypothetical protein OPQ81_011067 [Rhizoctonia solani]